MNIFNNNRNFRFKISIRIKRNRVKGILRGNYKGARVYDDLFYIYVGYVDYVMYMGMYAYV